MADVRRRAIIAALVCAAAAAALTSLAGPAAALTVTQQGTVEHDFTFESLPASLAVADGAQGDKDLQLAVVALDRIAKGSGSPVYASSECDARTVEALDDGDLLISDRSSRLVAVVSRAGEPVWEYTVNDDPDLQRPFSAQRFTRGGEELTLIADRDAYRVWAVNEAKDVVWQYGVTNEAGTTINHLVDPFYARYSEADGGSVVITDCNSGGNRVIEVRYGDYLAGVQDNGFTAQSVVWSYGKPGVEGSGPGELDKPHSAERLSDGNILITDEDAAHVIEVDRETGEIVWQYGVTGQPGGGEGQLREPNFARRLDDGDTLIADAGNSRVLRVKADREIDRVYDLEVEGRPSWVTSSDHASPRHAAYTADGLLAVADSGFKQIVLLGYEDSASAVSTPLDCQMPDVRKAFTKLTWKGDTGQSGTRVAVDYRLDGGAWRACKGISSVRAYDFPAGTVGKTIAYRVTLSSRQRGHTPTLDAISIQSAKATTGGAGGGGGGSGGSGNSGQSGIYEYPATAEGGTGTSGTGIGSGTYGSGSGNGSGSSGTGTSSSGAGAGATSTANTLDVPVESTGGGSAVPVQGYQVQGEEGVSGVPLRAAEGAHAPEPKGSGPPLSVLALIVAGMGVAAAFFVPWPFVAAHMRSITGFDHTRPARFLPFRPLGR
jgi:hypothetical protein